MKNKQPVRKDLFGFTKIPFISNPEKPYLDNERQLCLDKLQCFLQYRGFALLFAEPGCGKSILLNYLCDTLNTNSNKIIYIPFTNFSENDILKIIAQKLDLEVLYNKAMMVINIQKRIEEIQPVNPIIIIDEIQNISTSTLETVRLITNFKFDSPQIMSIIMAGTPEFLEKLRLRINEPIRQRITLFTKLKPLSSDHISAYINHCLASAGAHSDIFPPEAIQLIYDASRGIPRIINHLALGALQEASWNEKTQVTLDHVRSAVKQVILPERQVSS